MVAMPQESVLFSHASLRPPVLHLRLATALRAKAGPRLHGAPGFHPFPRLGSWSVAFAEGQKRRAKITSCDAAPCGKGALGPQLFRSGLVTKQQPIDRDIEEF